MSNAVRWIAVVAALAAGGVCLDRLGLWLEDRGWLYYRNSGHTWNTSIGNGLQELQKIVEPKMEYPLAEEVRTIIHEEADADPPTAGLRDDEIGGCSEGAERTS